MESLGSQLPWGESDEVSRHHRRRVSRGVLVVVRQERTWEKTPSVRNSDESDTHRPTHRRRGEYSVCCHDGVSLGRPPVPYGVSGARCLSTTTNLGIAKPRTP